MEKQNNTYRRILIVVLTLLFVSIYISQRASKQATEYIDKYKTLEKDLEKVVQRSIFVQDSLSKIIENKDDEIVKYIDNLEKEKQRLHTVIHRLRSYDADSSSSFVSGRVR